MRLLRERLCVLDTETTGLPGSEWARVVEVGAVIYDVDGTEISTFSSLVRPSILDERARPALEVNRLTVDEILAAPAEQEVVPAFLHWHHEHGAPWVSAYNVPFDQDFMSRLLGERRDALVWGRCIMAESSRLCGLRRRARLSEMAQLLGVPQQLPAHRALADARTAGEVLLALLRRYRSAA